MKIIVQEKYIIPQSPEGKEAAKEICEALILRDLFRGMKEDTVNIIISAEQTIEMEKEE